MALNQQTVILRLYPPVLAVTRIISVKYVWLVLRFDNDGEGGVAGTDGAGLIGLGAASKGASARALAIIATFGVFGGSAVLMAMHDHACDLGAIGGRRARGCHTALREVRGCRSPSVS